MNIWTKILIALGLIEKDFGHIMTPISKITGELEDLAARKRLQIVDSRIAIKMHQDTIDLASKAKAEADAGAAAVRALFMPKAA